MGVGGKKTIFFNWAFQDVSESVTSRPQSWKQFIYLLLGGDIRGTSEKADTLSNTDTLHSPHKKPILSSSAKTPVAHPGLSASTGHMLMPLSGLLWWWCCCYCCAWYRCGLCAPDPQMLRHQGLLKCRCRMLFNDLKVFLLRRPPPAPLPMHGDPQPPGLTANNNTLPALGAGGWAGWRGPREGVGRETPPLPPPPPFPPSSVEDDWGGPATEPPALLLSSASSDDFCKGKAEDRCSLGSSLDSGMRTPLCRICFQGPEQVRPFPPFLLSCGISRPCRLSFTHLPWGTVMLSLM